MLDLQYVACTGELQRRAFNFEPINHLPTVINYLIPKDEWPDDGFTEIFADPVKMFLHELRNVSAGVKLRDDRIYGIRANYGTGIIEVCEAAGIPIVQWTVPLDERSREHIRTGFSQMVSVASFEEAKQVSDYGWRTPS